jgi:hypothetical protein
MRKTGLLCLAGLLLAVPASAQTKVSGKAHCAKADPDYAVEVADKPGHVLTARKASCTWADGSMQIAGLTAKTGTDAATGEVNGATLRDSGYHTATMDNGDKMTVRFGGTMALAKDNTGSFDGKWTFVSGTGKLKGIKGSGTYKGTVAADGSAEVNVEGDYTLAPPPPPAAKKKK